MKNITFTSKRHGSYTISVDDIDYRRMRKLKTMKWCVSLKRNGLVYFQKRFSNNKIVEIHRWIMNPKKGEYVDHINRNTLDNRRKNLRICTNAANLRNSRTNSNNTSGRTGVWFNKRDGKWASEIKVNYKKIYLGRYKTFKDAVKAREQAEKEYWHI